jgi:hypothetical protein
MKHEAAQADLHPKDLINPKRDVFQALNVGLSYRQGHKKPALLELGSFQDLANALLGDVNIQRLASFQDGKSLTNFNFNFDMILFIYSATFALWHPKGYRYYNDNLNKLGEIYPQLAQCLFPRSIMPSAAFNLGNQVIKKSTSIVKIVHLDGALLHLWGISMEKMEVTLFFGISESS